MILDADALLALRTNKNGIASTYSDVMYYFQWAGYKQIKYKYNFTIANKDLTPPSGSKNDFLSLSPYYWHPDEIKYSTSIT